MPPAPTATPTCSVPNSYNARGTVAGVDPSASTFQFRQSNGCTYTIVVTTGTQIQINGATPTGGNGTITVIQQGDHGTVQGLLNTDGSIGAIQIEFTTPGTDN
jgi:hypothetical protein